MIEELTPKDEQNMEDEQEEVRRSPGKTDWTEDKNEG